MLTLNSLPLKSILLVILGGLFGWMLGKMPDRWVYLVMAIAILLTIVVILPSIKLTVIAL